VEQKVVVNSLGFVETSGRRSRVLSFLTSLYLFIHISLLLAPFVLVNGSSGSFSEEGY